jgi:hypothetical protein
MGVTDDPVFGVGWRGRLATVLLAVLGGGCMAQPSGDKNQQAVPPERIQVAASELQLLPFTIRMNKLASVLELPADDPLFAPLFEQRYALGDHDYARALRPDRRWSGRKIGIWVRGLLPICRSARFTELYPAVADAPNALIVRAYGRPASDEELASLREVETSGDLDRHTAVCVAVLSALELVTQ